MNTFNPFSLSGKKILITGASSGIGRQCAINCSKMGAVVALVGRDEKRLQETLVQMEGDGHLICPADLTILESIKPLVQDIASKIGSLDGFIHSAGIEKTLPVKSLKPSDYEEIFKVNALSAFEIVRYLSSSKNLNQGGSIVLISSITSVIGRVGVSAYAASKGAIVSAVKTMALELAKRNVRVNAVSPGTVLTPLMQSYLSQISEEERQKRVEGFPLGLGEPADVANACIYLLSEASRWVTGQNIVIDGGYTVQ